MSLEVTKKCTKCGICIEECPVSCIIMAEEHAIIDSDFCINCRACISVCPVDAIRVIGEINEKNKK